MVKVSWISAVALAIGLAAPAAAQDGGGDVDQINARSEARAARQEARAARIEAQAARRGDRLAAPEARIQTRAERRAEQAAAPEARVEARAERRAERMEARQSAGTGRNAPDGGWRSQRAGDGERYGRRWGNDGSVSRPDPARRGATPTIPTRGGDVNRTWSRDDSASDWRRNRTYTDPARNRTYRDGVRDGRRADRREDRVENRQAYRNGYRAGTRDDNWRNRSSGYHAGSRDHRRWDRNDWRRDRRYDWYGYRSQHRGLFSIGRYYSPYRNYNYRRPIIGLFLDNGFYGNRYWINDPWQYRLPEVYGPYRWVRYYDDVLLVDIHSGEVVDVIHDFFW